VFKFQQNTHPKIVVDKNLFSHIPHFFFNKISQQCIYFVFLHRSPANHAMKNIKNEKKKDSLYKSMKMIVIFGARNEQKIMQKKNYMKGSSPQSPL
jgi:hypothetical protein